MVLGVDARRQRRGRAAAASRSRGSSRSTRARRRARRSRSPELEEALAHAPRISAAAFSVKVMARIPSTATPSSHHGPHEALHEHAWSCPCRRPRARAASRRAGRRPRCCSGVRLIARTSADRRVGAAVRARRRSPACDSSSPARIAATISRMRCARPVELLVELGGLDAVVVEPARPELVHALREHPARPRVLGAERPRRRRRPRASPAASRRPACRAPPGSGSRTPSSRPCSCPRSCRSCSRSREPCRPRCRPGRSRRGPQAFLELHRRVVVALAVAEAKLEAVRLERAVALGLVRADSGAGRTRAAAPRRERASGSARCGKLGAAPLERLEQDAAPRRSRLARVTRGGPSPRAAA